MIVLTNLHGEPLAINDELIERVEGDHETRVILTGGTRYIVAESIEEVVARCREHRAEVLALSRRIPVPPATPASQEPDEDEDDPVDGVTGAGSARTARPRPDTPELHLLRMAGAEGEVPSDGGR